MSYKQLRVWARGASSGWGQDGELQFYIKIARDANNFYMYRTPIERGDVEGCLAARDHRRFPEDLYVARAASRTRICRASSATPAPASTPS